MRTVVVTALRNFVVEQHEEDSKVRFQQLQLTNDLLGLFIDVPVTLPQKADTRRANLLLEAADRVRERVAGGLNSKRSPLARSARAPRLKRTELAPQPFFWMTQ